MTNELSHKPRRWSVVQVVRIVPLVQVAFLNDANHVTNGKSLHLIVRDKQSRGVGGLQNVANF